MANKEMPLWTKHGKIRLSQRGVKTEVVQAVWQHGDREQPCGSGCFTLSISHRRLTALISMGVVPAKLAEHCAKLKIVTNGETLITVYKNDN